jgi:hypothetical protein
MVSRRCSLCRNFGDGGTGGGFVDDGLVVGVGGQQGLDGEVVELPETEVQRSSAPPVRAGGRANRRRQGLDDLGTNLFARQRIRQYLDDPDMLAGREWAYVLTDEDKRALSTLLWMHIQPYGEVRLNMGSRLQLAVPTDPEPEPAAA